MRPYPATVWQKSSYSGGTGDCVEVADLRYAVAIRDSKNPTGPTLVLTRATWRAFTEAVKHNPQDGA